MAISAVVTLSNTTAMSGQSLDGFLTVSNSGASPVNIQWISRDIPPANGATTGRVAFNLSAFKPGLISVPNAGNVVLPFRVAIFSPQIPGASALSYTLNVNVYTDDGSATAATGATTIYIYPPSGTAVPNGSQANFSLGATQDLVYPVLFV